MTPSARSSLRDRLTELVDEMVGHGIRFEDALREFERNFLQRALAEAQGNMGRAAHLLGIHRNTLSRKLAEQRGRGARP